MVIITMKKKSLPKAPTPGSTRAKKPTAKAKEEVDNYSGSDEEGGLGAVKKARKKKKKKEGDEEEDEEEDGLKVDWKDETLTWSLITAISDDEDIRCGLFPPPGGNTSTVKGGGKPKTDHYWTLTQVVFSDHPKYVNIFSTAIMAPQQRVWQQKVKNCIGKLRHQMNAYTKEMGQTGEGIKDEHEIDMSKENEFTNKWATIKKACPWYFEMRSLISECPNSVPVGLGNNTSGYDLDILLPAPVPDVADIDEEVEEDNNGLAEVEIDELDGDNDLDISTEWLALTEHKHKLDSSDDAAAEKKPKIEDTTAAKVKALASTSVESSTPAAPSKQQPPPPGTSEPVSSIPHSKKGNTAIDHDI